MQLPVEGAKRGPEIRASCKLEGICPTSAALRCCIGLLIFRADPQHGSPLVRTGAKALEPITMPYYGQTRRIPTMFRNLTITGVRNYGSETGRTFPVRSNSLFPAT